MGHIVQVANRIGQIQVDSRRYYALAQGLDPNRADVYEQLARHSAQIEKYEDALDFWQKALQVNSSLPGAHLGMGSARQNLGQLDESITAFQEELRLDPLNGQAHYLLAEALFQRQSLVEAKASYQKAVELEPLNSRAYYGLIKTCTRLGQKEEAQKIFTELADAGRRQLEGGESADFFAKFGEQQTRQARTASAHFQLGLAYLGQGMTVESQKAFQQATQMNLADPWAAYYAKEN